MSGKDRADRVMETCGKERTSGDTRRSAIKIYYPTLTRKAKRPFEVDRNADYEGRLLHKTHKSNV